MASEKEVKMVQLNGVYTRGMQLPEQGTWHRQRKKAIMEAHPEVKTLFGNNPMTAAYLAVAFIAHMGFTYFFSQVSWYWMVAGAYTVGAWLGFVLQVFGHEGTHRLVFDQLAGNKLVAIVAFLPLFGGPFGMLWMAEHMQHHITVVDKCVRYGPQSNAWWKKALLALVFIAIVNVAVTVGAIVLAVPLFIVCIPNILGMKIELPSSVVVNPYKRFPNALNGWMAFNILACATYWYLMYTCLGWQAMIYQFLSSSFMNGLHPLGMRQVQEHYFKVKGQPTYSLYTSVAPLTFNICYHVEHHDFANIPWNRLPELRKMAPEFYNNLVYYNSYTEVLWEFLFNDGIPLDVIFEDNVLE